MKIVKKKELTGNITKSLAPYLIIYWQLRMPNLEAKKYFKQTVRKKFKGITLYNVL